MPDEKEPEPNEVKVKLNFRIPPRMPSVYAHHMLLQEGELEVVLSFFEVMLPIITEDLPESDRLKLLQESGLVAECVARITIAKGRFPNFAKAMQQLVERSIKPEGPQDDANNTRDNPKG